MKKTVSFLLLIILTCMLFLPVSAESTVKIKSIKLSEKKIVLQYGQSYTVKATITPSDIPSTSIEWISSNDAVCTVDNDGTVKAIGAGDCDIICSAIDGSKKTAKLNIHVIPFSIKEASVTIDKSEGIVVPLTLGGLSLSYLTSNAKSNNHFLYFVDWEGIHLFPVSAGKGTLTLISKQNRKDTITLDVEVSETAVQTFNSPEDPLTAIIVVPDSYISGNFTTNYFIHGGTPPYQVQINNRFACLHLIGFPQTAHYSAPTLAKTGALPYGSTNIKYDFSVGVKSSFGALVSLDVIDSSGKTVTVYSNRLYRDAVIVFAKEEYIAAPRSSTITNRYEISNGSGYYSLDTYWDNNARVPEKIKLNKANEMSLSHEIDPFSEYTNPRIIIADTKEKGKDTFFEAQSVRTTDGITAVLKTDASYDLHENEEITVTISSTAPFTTTESAWEIIRYNPDDPLWFSVDSEEMILKQIDNNTWSATLTVPDCEFLRFNLKTEELSWIRKDFRVVK